MSAEAHLTIAEPDAAHAARVAGGLRSSAPNPPRVEARGKFLFAGADKLYIRGVTYGTFRPDEHGREFHDVPQVERDFAAMAATGINAVRTYTVPPVGCANSVSRGEVVFVDEAAESDAPLDSGG